MDHNRELWGLEEGFVRDWIDKGRRINRTDHAEKRMDERRVTMNDIKYALRAGRIVEGHAPFEYPRGEHPHENQHPIRSFYAYRKESGRFLVVALAYAKTSHGLSFHLVTVYWKVD
ncbi:MAG: DUF4258 domain-containing protein [Bacilli bacterium]